MLLFSQHCTAQPLRVAYGDPPPLTQGRHETVRIVTPLNNHLPSYNEPGGPRCPALPVADKAGHKRVQRSARDEGILAEDIRRAPQTDRAVDLPPDGRANCLPGELQNKKVIFPCNY